LIVYTLKNKITGLLLLKLHFEIVINKVACRNSFGPMPKVKTPYIVPKLPKRRNAETAETAKTVLAFRHSFGITDTNILYEFWHSFDFFNYINLLKLKKKLKKTFLLAVKDLLQYFINILL
jgi:hypothetical protein